MKLSEFDLEQSIFVDANIFNFHFGKHPTYGLNCTEFLERIELSKVVAVTSDIVLNEVFYVEMIGKGCQILSTDKRWAVRKQFEHNEDFAKQCYSHLQEISDYIRVMEGSNLTIVNTGRDILFKSVELGAKYRLWTRDAIHTATCSFFQIMHIATKDEHFDRVSFLERWSP